MPPEMGLSTKTGAAGLFPSRPLLLKLAGPGAESALQAKLCSAGDPSEVTALGKRHWITSFHC